MHEAHRQKDPTDVARLSRLFAGGAAGLYGTLSKLPPAFLEESAKVFLDTMSQCASDSTPPGGGSDSDKGSGGDGAANGHKNGRA